VLTGGRALLTLRCGNIPHRPRAGAARLLHSSSIAARPSRRLDNEADAIVLWAASPLYLNTSRVTSVSIKSASTPHQPIASDPCTSHQGTILTQNGRILLVARALPCFGESCCDPRTKDACAFRTWTVGRDRGRRVPPTSALEGRPGQMFVSNRA
jgi:hypothetical protein